jgi:hypothetical protein
LRWPIASVRDEDAPGGGHVNPGWPVLVSVSEGTVRKHLENIYTRLQVSSRTAAVTRAFPEQQQRAVALGDPPLAAVRDS